MRRSISVGSLIGGTSHAGGARPQVWMPALIAALCLGLLVPALPAQTTSTITGRVTDPQGAAIAGAEVTVASPTLAITRQTTSDATGTYRVSGLPAGDYNLSITKAGFATYKLNRIEVTLNRTFTLDAAMNVATVATEVSVSGAAQLLEPTTSSSGSTITPQQIQEMPLNGRNYLDMMQLVPGIALNRQEDPTSDVANPILGERGGNALYLIDGMSNTDQFSGGAASQFNQESILEFQVLTAGYKAEFGHASGGVINVVSKGGTNQWHGGVSFFHRNYKLDSSDIKGEAKPRFLLRWDPSVQIGGPLIKDRVFFFASAERIRESRELNSVTPPIPAAAAPYFTAQETPFDLHNQTYDSRVRAKLDEQVGHHRFSQQVNWTNTAIKDFLPLSEYTSFPSQRSNLNSRHLFLGFTDTATLGSQANPFLLNVYGQYRGEPSVSQAAHPSAGVAYTIDNFFSGLDTGGLFGDAGQASFGYGQTPTILNQKYTSFGASLAKHKGRHDIKFGWDFQRTVVDGTEYSILQSQLFATTADQVQFGPVNSGVYLLTTEGGATAKDSTIAIRNNYNGLFVQDDIKLLHNLTVSPGLRWDYDARFPNNGSVSPRIGAAWSVTPKTIIRGSYGLFYDHFRLGLARDVPGFGGANILGQYMVGFPRLFYGNPSIFLPLFSLIGYNTPCTANSMTDAQIAAAGATCMNPTLPLYGIDHLNNVVASGHAPIPANVVVTKDNIQQLSGLTPDQFALQAAAAIGKPAGYFTYDLFGNLASGTAIMPPFTVPATVDPGFKTPYSQAFQIGVQREITSDVVVQVDYYHRDIRDILGVRSTNLAFDSRLTNGRTSVPGTGDLITGYGPWFRGTYDGLVLAVRKRMSHRFTLEGSYTYANETDNVTAYTGTGTAAPSDSFVGTPPVITEAASATGPCAHPSAALSNANGRFIAANCNPVPQAGKFYNGPDLDKGTSALALKHTFLLHGLWQLPWKFEFSGIVRVQSGFPYYRSDLLSVDVDGDAHFNGIDHCAKVTDCLTTPVGTLKRNSFTAPIFANMDLRVAKHFDFGERLKLHAYFEMFNLFNNDNTAAVEQRPYDPRSTTIPSNQKPFGSTTQVLPGREGQVGIRIEF